MTTILWVRMIITIIIIIGLHLKYKFHTLKGIEISVKKF